MRFDRYDTAKMKRHIEEVQAYDEDRARTQDAADTATDGTEEQQEASEETPEQ